MKIGSKVGAHRWPYNAAHPDCWGRPWSGVVLEVTDPRAWAGSIAFPSKPTRAQVAAHVAHCEANGSDFSDRAPVLWDFGPNGSSVHWEKVDGTEHAIRPYAEDLEAWSAARWEAKAKAAA